MDPQMMQGLFMPTSGSQHSQALEYLQQLRATEDAWKVCSATLASNGVSLDDRSKFLCLQMLESYAKGNYESATTEDQALLRQNVSQWLSILCLEATQEKVFIRNKTAQLLSLLFVADYVNRWPTFMSDLLSTLSLGANSVDLYLKVLLAIDSEIVDRDFLHSQSETDRSTQLKDTMRDRSVIDMANSWYDILLKYEKSHPELVCHCHDVIGAYISWIDINLIANDKFVPILVKHLKDPLLREAAADCINEILLKGMTPVAKLQLIESFYNVLEEAGVMKPIDDDDSDFLVKLGKLVNCIGTQLISCWNKLEKNDAKMKEVVRLAVENKITLLMQFMASEYDDVSQSTFDFAKDYIQLIRQSGHLTEVEKGQLENMLHVIITKTKYDESYNFEMEGEDEAMFDEYRRHLKVVFDNLSALVPDLVLKVCKDFVLTTLNRWQSSPYEDVEAAVSLLYSLGEALPASHGNHFSSPAQAKTSIMGEMMKLLVTSGISGHSHPAVVMQFFECVSRYEKYFTTEQHHIPGVLGAFLDQRGMRNPSAKVRSRTSYLFSRFVRCLKSHLSNYTEQILSQIAELLVLPPIENGQLIPLLSSDNQLYVYEAAALLIISGPGDAPRKELLMNTLLSPVFTKVSSHAQKLQQETNLPKQMLIANNICHAMAVTARTSKAFSNQNTMHSCNCSKLFLDAMHLFLSCLNIGIEREIIGSGVRQLMHRLVVCLDGNDLIPILPIASQALLYTPSINALAEYLPLINQMITKFKQEVLPFVSEIFSPLIAAIFSALTKEMDDNDEEEQRTRKTLRRSYYQFLTIIISCGLMDVLTAQDQAVLEQVLSSIIQGAIEFPDPVAQKTCFTIFRRLTEAWACDRTVTGFFVAFLYAQVVPACFMAPLKHHFDLNDAQALLALHESAMCLRTIYDQRGDEMITFLRTDYLPKMKLSPQLIDEYCLALVSDVKMYRNYSKMFFQRAKS